MDSKGLTDLRIGAYARFSSDAQRDSSIEAQFRLIREFVERHGGLLRDELMFADRAVSGTKSSRDGYDRLWKLIEAKAIDVIIAESADRFSRDLGNSDRLWKLCRYHDVRIVCVSDGIDSATRGARLQFGFKSMMSDEYLDDLRAKTLRGLRETFAEKKGATGGLPYGLTSRPVWSGGREHDYCEIIIDADRAATVARIFELYVSGQSYLAIATTLNREGVEPPRAKSKRRAPKMWRKGTIAAMIQNRTYIGEFTFGEREWRRDPLTGKRRYVKRDEGVQRDHRPELAIVPTELFDEANARRKDVGKRKASGKRTQHPFSGLLHCSVCGSRMVHVGGAPRHYYACNRHHAAGTCENSALVREDFLREAAFTELRKVLSSDQLWADLRADVERRVQQLVKQSDSERERLERELIQCKVEIDRLMKFISTTDDAASMDTIREAVAEASARKRALEARLASVAIATPEAPRLPTPDEVRTLAIDLEARVAQDPTGFREFLRSEFLKDGHIVMEPQPDASYIGRSEILPLNVPPARRKRKAPAEGSARAFGSLATVGCGGRI